DLGDRGHRSLEGRQKRGLKIVASSPECAKARSETRDSTWTYSEGRARTRQSNRDAQLILRSTVHQRALVTAKHHPFQRTRNKNREHLEQHVLIATERERGGVHHPQIVDDRLVERELGIAPGRWILRGIGGVDAIDLGGLCHGIHPHLPAAQRRGGDGGEKPVSRN